MIIDRLLESVPENFGPAYATPDLTHLVNELREAQQIVDALVVDEQNQR